MYVDVDLIIYVVLLLALLLLLPFTDENLTAQ